MWKKRTIYKILNFSINKKFLIDVNKLVQVIIFGNALDRITKIGFTHSNNCNDSKKIDNMIKTENYIIINELFLRLKILYKYKVNN